MFDSFFVIFKNVFFAFTLIPFSSGTYYSTAIMFFGNFMPFVAKILAIITALSLNFSIGLIMRRAFNKKEFEPLQNKLFFALLLSFIPVISGFIAFYFGLSRAKFLKFLPIIFFVNVLYYSIALYFPFLNIYF